MYIERPSLVQKGKQVRVWIAPQGLRYEYAPSLEGFLLSEPVTIETGTSRRNLKIPGTSNRDFETIAVVYAESNRAVLGSLSARFSADTRSILLALAKSHETFDMIWAYGDGYVNNIDDYDKVEIFEKVTVSAYQHESTGGFISSTDDVMERVEFFVDDLYDYTKPEVVKTTTFGGRVTDSKIVDFPMCVQCFESSGCCEYYPVVVTTVVYDLGVDGEALYLLATNDGGETWSQNFLSRGLFGEPKIVVQGTRTIVLPDSDIPGEFYYVEGKYLLSGSDATMNVVVLDGIDTLTRGASTDLGQAILVARNGTVLLVPAGVAPENAVEFTNFYSLDVAINKNDVFLLGNDKNILWLHGVEKAIISTEVQYNKLWVGGDLSLFAKDGAGNISWYKPGKGTWHNTELDINDMVYDSGITYNVNDIGLYSSITAMNSQKFLDGGSYLYVDSAKRAQAVVYATDSDVYLSLGSIEQMTSCPYDKTVVINLSAEIDSTYICDDGVLKITMVTYTDVSPNLDYTYDYTILGPYGTTHLVGDPITSYAELAIVIPPGPASDEYYLSVTVTAVQSGSTATATSAELVPCTIVDCGDGECIECYNLVPLVTDICC